MGHDNTKRIHLHGIIWTELTEEQFEKEWGYGWIFFGYEVNERTINYIIKYITKRDEDNQIQRKDIHFKKDRNRLHKQRHTQKTQISRQIHRRNV